MILSTLPLYGAPDPASVIRMRAESAPLLLSLVSSMSKPVAMSSTSITFVPAQAVSRNCGM
jgi:hypothetical protein